jgi:uncharacterized protein DUF1508
MRFKAGDTVVINEYNDEMLPLKPYKKYKIKDIVGSGYMAFVGLPSYRFNVGYNGFSLYEPKPTAHLRPAKNGFRFNLVAANGEKVATSEVYTTKAMAKKTLKKYFPDFEIVEK